MFDIAQQPAQIPQVQIEPPSILQSYNPTLLKRATFDGTCTSDQKAAIGLAATNCATLAQYGSEAAKYDKEKANVLLHEVTHLRNVKGTDDYSSWGHADVLELSESQNLNHADTYTFFAESARLRG
ncbi:hypothetical protein MCOR05_001260 [Pyricularia oryzae]|nr:hypothetical protein MCOR05_001260 [Pyricularia oryzae]